MAGLGPRVLKRPIRGLTVSDPCSSATVGAEGEFVRRVTGRIQDVVSR